MSSRGQALRDLVVERLVLAADEIFALFEQTFAEYEQNVVSRRLQDHQYHIRQDPSEELRREEVQTLEEQTEIIPNLDSIKPEEEEVPLDLQFPVTVKSEEDLHKPTLFEQEPTEEPHWQEAEEEEEEEKEKEEEEEEPGACSYSDNDGSEDWQPVHKKRRKAGFGGRTKSFRCSICRKRFSEYYLKQHMRVHTGEKPFHCEPCGLSFTFRPNYRHHKRSAHCCQVCHREFTHTSELSAHKETHEETHEDTDEETEDTDEETHKETQKDTHRPFKCLNCNKTFALIKDLMSHKMSGRCHKDVSDVNEDPSGYTHTLKFVIAQHMF